MPAFIVSAFTWLFTGLINIFMPIINFFSKALFVSPLLVINLALAASLISLVTGISILLKSIYEIFSKFFDSLNNAATGAVGVDIISVGFDVLKAMGIWKAFYDVSLMIMPLLFAFFLLIGSKLSYRIYKEKRDAYYQAATLMNNDPSSKKITKK